MQDLSVAPRCWTSGELKQFRWRALTDPIVLAKAAENGRVLVSHDVTTMALHFREFAGKQTSPGLVLIPQRRMSIGQAIESLVLLWEVLEAADLENRICLFPSLAIY